MKKEKSEKIIFITVGNGKFDPLIKEVDRLVGEGKITENVVMQIGHGSYKPKNCQWFGFAPLLDEYYKKAELVISHGGPGIVFEVLRRGNKLIALPNRDRTDPNHQVEYLWAMATETCALLYCDEVKMLYEILEKAKTHKFEKYKTPFCGMGNVLKRFLG